MPFKEPLGPLQDSGLLAQAKACEVSCWRWYEALLLASRFSSHGHILGHLLKSEDGSFAFEGLGATRDFYKDVDKRNSIDDRGMRLEAFVHDDKNFQNAYWDGKVMVFGDGDGKLFLDFTKSLDVIAHELTHGVTEFTAGLEYHNESGALNQSISDVMGSLVKQWSLKQTADQADWLVGAEIFTPKSGQRSPA